MHYRHVAYRRYQHERVDRNVGRHIQQVVHQLADDIPERPDGRGELVRRERRADQHERQVGEGEVQQQEVRHGAHPVLGQDHVDDETVAESSDERDQAE